MTDTPTPPQGPEGQKPADPTLPAAPGLPGTPDPADVEKNKTSALLSYIFILWLVPLLSAKDSPYAKYHCNQGILLSIVGFGGGVALGILSFILAFIPYGGCLSCTVYAVYLAGMLTLMIMGIMNALAGKMKPLPLFPVITFVK